jgi:Rod binding domain-containing protein
MLESMFAGVEISKPFGGGNAEQQYRSVLLGEYAKNITQSGGIGVADAVYREILAIQEGQV